MFYFGGTFPHDPFWGFSGFTSPQTADGDDCCCCCCRFRHLCLPIASVVYVFPVLPENAWGGVLGYWCLGTHQRTPVERMYAGGNRFIDFMGMGWRRHADLHGDEDWRSRVFDFLAGDASPVVEASHWPQTSPNDPQARLLNEYLEDGKQVLQIGLARAVLIRRPLNKGQDKCVQSSFEDYQQNVCWICREESEEWDMWLSCHHIFCARCSSQMLLRRMPCPLCRVASTTVLRGEHAGRPRTFESNMTNLRAAPAPPQVPEAPPLPSSREAQAAPRSVRSAPEERHTPPEPPKGQPNVSPNSVLPKPVPYEARTVPVPPQQEDMPALPKVTPIGPAKSLDVAKAHQPAAFAKSPATPIQEAMAPLEMTVASAAAKLTSRHAAESVEATTTADAADVADTVQKQQEQLVIRSLPGMKRLKGFQTSTGGAPYFRHASEVPLPAAPVEVHATTLVPTGPTIPSMQSNYSKCSNHVSLSTGLVSLSGMRLLKKNRGQDGPRILCSTAGTMFKLRTILPANHEAQEPLESLPQMHSLSGFRRLQGFSTSTGGMMLANLPSHKLHPLCELEDEGYQHRTSLQLRVPSTRVLSGSFRLRRFSTSCGGLPYCKR